MRKKRKRKERKGKERKGDKDMPIHNQRKENRIEEEGKERTVSMILSRFRVRVRVSHTPIQFVSLRWSIRTCDFGTPLHLHFLTFKSQKIPNAEFHLFFSNLVI